MKKPETTVGRLEKLYVLENYLRTWMKGIQAWGILLPCWLLMRPCIHIMDILYSSNTIQTNQLSMAYCTDVSAILQYLTFAIPYLMLVNQEKLKVQLQSITSLEPVSIPDISSISCLYTETFNKLSIYLQGIK